ncbi:hypothetical protein FGRA07_11363 [Fusarium graminearum]|nr:hypothetical protein HG531_013249 [Fusarium graminearum]PCD24161.1 hypothetical protein FGRA07_11363 [Fusarium graminearum]
MVLQSHDFLFSLSVSGKYSDFTLVCNGGHEFKLHQVIVCPQSSVITAALSGGFQEATSKVLNVTEFDVDTVQYMISFLYTGEYQISSKGDKPDSDDGSPQEEDSNDAADQASQASSHLSEPDETVDDLFAHLRVNAIADYYNIQNLAQLANTKIRAILDLGQNTEAFPRIIQEVSTSNRDINIRSIIASAAVARIEELCHLKAFQELELEQDFSATLFGACSERIETLERRLHDAQANVVMYQTLRDDERQAKQSVIEQVNRSTQMLQLTPSCRHCEENFGCYFERGGLDQNS